MENIYLCECGCKLHFDVIDKKRVYYIKCGNQVYMYQLKFCPMCGVELMLKPEIELGYKYWLKWNTLKNLKKI